MVDAGSRAASVTIHRVMDTEHGLGNVTGEIMLNTLLNHCTMTNQTLSEPIQKELFEIKDFDTVWLPRVFALTLILGTRTGKQECLGKHWIQSNSQQFVWLEELRTVSQFKKSLMNAQQLTMTYIDTEDSLRGSCCWKDTDRKVSLRKS